MGAALDRAAPLPFLPGWLAAPVHLRDRLRREGGADAAQRSAEGCNNDSGSCGECLGNTTAGLACMAKVYARPKRPSAKKKSPGAGSAEARTQLHRTHYRPRPNTTGQVQHASGLWQFCDESLSVSLIATRICGHTFTPAWRLARTPPRPTTPLRPRSSPPKLQALCGGSPHAQWVKSGQSWPEARGH